MRLKNLYEAAITVSCLASCSPVVLTSNYGFSVGEKFVNKIFGHSDKINHFYDEIAEQDIETPSDWVDSFDFSKNPSGTTYDITKEGTYVFLGNNSNGSIEVNVDGDVTIFLDNVNIHSINKPVINAAKCNNLTIHLLSKTVNYLTDSESNKLGAVIYATCPTKIVGQGFLKISAFGVNESKTVGGIYSESSLDFEDARVIVKYSNNASVYSDGDINFNDSKIDVIDSDLGGVETPADVTFNNSVFLYKGKRSGIHCANFKAVASDFEIETSGEFEAISGWDEKKNGVFIKNKFGYDQILEEDYDGDESLYTMEYPSCGILTSGDLEVETSILHFKCDDSAFCSLNDISILNSVFEIDSKSNGMYAKNDINVVVSDSTLKASKIFDSFNGIEGNSLTFSGAEIYILSNSCSLISLEEDISFTNGAKAWLEIGKEGINSQKNISLDNCSIFAFASDSDGIVPFKYVDKFNLVNSNVFSLGNISIDDNLVTNNKKLYCKVDLSGYFDKYSALHFYGDNFYTSIILPFDYESLYFSVFSSNLNYGSYKIGKNGYVNYQFTNYISVKRGKAEGYDTIKEIKLNQTKSEF